MNTQYLEQAISFLPSLLFSHTLLLHPLLPHLPPPSLLLTQPIDSGRPSDILLTFAFSFSDTFFFTATLPNASFLSSIPHLPPPSFHLTQLIRRSSYTFLLTASSFSSRSPYSVAQSILLPPPISERPPRPAYRGR